MAGLMAVLVMLIDCVALNLGRSSIKKGIKVRRYGKVKLTAKKI